MQLPRSRSGRRRHAALQRRRLTERGVRDPDTGRISAMVQRSEDETSTNPLSTRPTVGFSAPT